MTLPATDLLLELSHRGVAVIPEGDRLRLRPRSAITPDLLNRIHALRPAILALLAGHTLQALLHAGGLPTPDEWRVLAVLADGALRTHPQLLATTRLSQAALTRALASLRARRELTVHTACRFRIVIN